jgi:hypothetical protein
MKGRHNYAKPPHNMALLNAHHCLTCVLINRKILRIPHRSVSLDSFIVVLGVHCDIYRSFTIYHSWIHPLHHSPYWILTIFTWAMVAVKDWPSPRGSSSLPSEDVTTISIMGLEAPEGILESKVISYPGYTAIALFPSPQGAACIEGFLPCLWPAATLNIPK